MKHAQVLKVSTEILDYIEYEYLDNERKEYRELKLNEFKRKLELALNRTTVSNIEIQWR